MLFTDKYAPRKWPEFLGNSEILAFAQKWASAWEKGEKQKPLLLYGPPGIGKSTLPAIIANEMQWQMFELNASDFRTKENIEKFAGVASQSSTFFGKTRLIFLDEIDGLQAQDRGGLPATIQVLKDTQTPIILAANDIYANQKLSQLRSICELMQFKKINYLSIAKYLKEICKKENIVFDEDAIKALAQNCEGDLRSALLDLQSLSLSGAITSECIKQIGFRQREENVFETVGKLFRAHSVAEVREARNKSECDDDLLMLWIEENIPRVFKPEDVAPAMDYFSKGDLFEGRIFRKQNYGFRRYSYDLMSSSLLRRNNDYHGWIQYVFPQLLKSLGADKASRNIKSSICKKIARKIHASSKSVMWNELPLVKQLSENKEKAPSIAYEFGFDEDEIAFLLDTKPETKKVQHILEQANKLKQKNIISKGFGKVYEEKEADAENTDAKKIVKKSKKKIPAEKSNKPTLSKTEIIDEPKKQTTLFV